MRHGTRSTRCAAEAGRQVSAAGIKTALLVTAAAGVLAAVAALCSRATRRGGAAESACSPPD
ncbi:hypothetical protein [Amycolatopsis sp. H20-H5]|uniref:hypothetical protein n=1 Tax=Amycolatopsis sp. H20-H5 TaxID=3046309 RepID=UPI002DB9068D|nr:hypothetical protein [Amycolatopsis sp. H20-H5]MEC3977717.1 hypothetical protein [Amycolatopsis sp. H20-H5]